MSAIPFIALMIPIIALLIPIVAILTQHQRQMAEVVHRNPTGQLNSEMEAMRQEIQQLKELVHQQAIAMDNLVTMQSRQGESIQQRVGNGVG